MEEGAGAGSGEIGASKMLVLTRKGVLSPDLPGDEVQRSRHRGVVPDATFLWDAEHEKAECFRCATGHRAGAPPGCGYICQVLNPGRPRR